MIFLKLHPRMEIHNLELDKAQVNTLATENSHISQVLITIDKNDHRLQINKLLTDYTTTIVADQKTAKNIILNILKQNVNIFQSNASLAQCKQMINMTYAANQKACIVIMNTWSMEQMENFIDKYTTLPEAMLGKLFSLGLSPDILPNDIKQSKPFLHVAVVNNPERLINEILSKFDIQTSRLCISQLDKDDIKTLSRHNLPLMYLPIRILESEAQQTESILSKRNEEYKQPMFLHIIKSISTRQVTTVV